MLQDIRNKTKTILVQILLGLIALSFVGWGIADYTRGGSAGQYAVQVGKRGIPSEQIENAVRQQQQELRNVIGSTVDEPVFKQEITRNVVEQLINRALYVQGAHDLGLEISPDLQRKMLLNEKAFQQNGTFDRAQFDYILQSAGLTEERYLKELSEGLQVNMIAKTVEKSLPPVDYLTELLLKRQKETRKLSIYKAALPDVDTPDDKTLVKYFRQNKEDFLRPPVMDIAILDLHPGKLADNINIQEDAIQQRYAEIEKDLGEPERRTVKLLLTDTEEDAKLIYSSENTFEELVAARENRRLSNVTDVTIDSFPGEALGEAIFATVKDKKTAPVKSPLGWHVAIVTGIKPAKKVSFEEAQKDIKDRLALEQAYEQMTVAVEELFDNEMSLFTLPDSRFLQQPIKIIKGKNFTEIGNEELFQKNSELSSTLKEAMNAPKSLQRANLNNDSLVILQVTDQRPAPIPALDSIKEEVIAAYKLEQAKEKAQDLRIKSVSLVKKGKSPKNFTLKKTDYLKNDQLQDSAGILAGQVQQGRQGEVFEAVTGKGITIIKIIDVKRPESIKADTQQYKETQSEIRQSVVADMLNALSNAYRQEHEVRVNLEGL